MEINDRLSEGKRAKRALPAVALINTKYPHNLAAAIRAASCFDVDQIWFTGNRILDDLKGKSRIPREERMKGYNHVNVAHTEYFLEQYRDKDTQRLTCTPVCVEILENVTSHLPLFEHPENALYIFGPEDGQVPQVYRQHCHHFIFIPAYHCLSLGNAVNVVLYDRISKEMQNGTRVPLPPGEYLKESRGFININKDGSLSNGVPVEEDNNIPEFNIL